MRSRTVLSNFLWRFAERCGAQLVSAVVTIILARLLMPEDYGVVALMTVVIDILNVFVASGLGTALIQKKDADDTDFSTVFYTNVLFCLAMYALLFLGAPLIARFYKNPDMTAMLRVLGIVILISGVKNVQISYVSRHMQFRRFFFATLGGTLGAAVVGIWMAYRGYGAWALIAQHLFNTAVDTLILWITVKWRPKRLFSFERLKGLFSFGWKMLASSLVATIYNNLRTMIIGKKYTSSDLAFYKKGETWPGLFVTNINYSIDSVLLPTMSNAQDEPAAVKSMVRRAIKTSTYLMAPALMGLFFVSEPVIRLVLTEKWMPILPFQRIFCITYMFYPIHTANLSAIKAMGRSDLYLKLEILKKIVGMVLLLTSMWFGVMAMAYSLLANSLITQLLNTRPNKRLLNYGYLEQLKDILPGIALAVGMGAAVYCVRYLHLSDLATLAIQIPLGVAIYVGVSALFRMESFRYLLSIVKSYLGKKKQPE